MTAERKQNRARGQLHPLLVPAHAGRGRRSRPSRSSSTRSRNRKRRSPSCNASSTPRKSMLNKLLQAKKVLEAT